jgi:hypothetical protein
VLLALRDHCPGRGLNSQIIGARSQDRHAGIPYSRPAARLIGICDGSIHPADTCMTRDDVMFWLLLAWLIFLCGMALWILFVP